MIESQAQQQLSEAEIKRRRREKILARANNANRDSQPTQSQNTNQPQLQQQPLIQPQPQSHPQPQPQPQPQPTQQPLSPFQMFRLSQAHDQHKKNLQYASIAAGIGCAILHIFLPHGDLVFGACLLVISALTLNLSRIKSRNIQKFTTSPTGTIEVDPIITHVSSIKQLEIANKVLDFQQSMKPVCKLLASYFLATIAMGLVVGVETGREV